MVGSVASEDETCHVTFEVGMDGGVQGTCSCAAVGPGWCMHLVDAALHAHIEIPDWVPDVGGVYGVVFLEGSGDNAQQGFNMARVTGVDPITVHMLARNRKGRWYGQELSAPDEGGRRGKRKRGVPYIKEVDVEMMLLHKVTLTSNGGIALVDTQIVERLNE